MHYSVSEEQKIFSELLSGETLNILEKLSSNTPSNISGYDRINLLDEKLNKLTIVQKSKLTAVFNSLLQIMVEMKASDLEFGGYGTRGKVWLRIFGSKEPFTAIPNFNSDYSALIILSLFNERQRKALLQNRNIDFSYSLDDLNETVRFRGDAFFDVDLLAVNIRCINPELRKLEELGFHDNVLKVLSYNYLKQGLILVTGITGSGKSTTLDAIINWHNENVNAQIVTVALPIEYLHCSKKCMIRQREVGRDVLSFRDGVIQALRQDLDIMVIGEMRDSDTIIAALEVTDTGHKVFSTLHTSSAVESIDRIIAEVNTGEQYRVRIRLADTLSAIISQKLVPGLDGKLILAKEVLLLNPSVRAAIKNGNTSEIYMMINQSGSSGMITLEQDLRRLYLEGKISYDTALQNANNKDVFIQLSGVLV